MTIQAAMPISPVEAALAQLKTAISEQQQSLASLEFSDTATQHEERKLLSALINQLDALVAILGLEAIRKLTMPFSAITHDPTVVDGTDRELCSAATASESDERLDEDTSPDHAAPRLQSAESAPSKLRPHIRRKGRRLGPPAAGPTPPGDVGTIAQVKRRKQKIKLRNLRHVMEQHAATFSKKGSTACVFFYFDPFTQDWKGVGCASPGRPTAHLEEIVDFLQN